MIDYENEIVRSHEGEIISSIPHTIESRRERIKLIERCITKNESMLKGEIDRYFSGTKDDFVNVKDFEIVEGMTILESINLMQEHIRQHRIRLGEA